MRKKVKAKTAKKEKREPTTSLLGLTANELNIIAGRVAMNGRYAPPALEKDVAKLGRLLVEAAGVLQQIEKVEAVLKNPLVSCAECLEEFDADELTDGVCDECRKEECPECEGTGMNPDYNDEEDESSDCDYCGGDGVV